MMAKKPMSERAERHHMRVFVGAMDAGATSKEKGLLAVLASLNGPDDVMVDITIPCLAAGSGMSEALVKRTLKGLVERGLVRPYQRYELLTPLGKWPIKDG